MYDKRPLRHDVIPSVQIARILIKVGFVEKRTVEPLDPEVRLTKDGLAAFRLLERLIDLEAVQE